MSKSAPAAHEQDDGPTMVRATSSDDMSWRSVALPASEQMIFEVVRLRSRAWLMW